MAGDRPDAVDGDTRGPERAFARAESSSVGRLSYHSENRQGLGNVTRKIGGGGGL